ncbi:MAG TPA: glycosyltransferase family 87 protein [Ktedonobacterales bacterium]|nr:glycosyltransferase family 87 protein [Ktedonobacterales bacterium]
MRGGNVASAAPGKVTVWGWFGRLLMALDGDARAARWTLAGAWGATRLALFVGMLLSHSYCDPGFYKYAGYLAAGQWPYRNVPAEYPPLAILLLLLPALPLLPFAGIAPRPDRAFNTPIIALPHPNPVRYAAYGISFAVEMLVIDALTLWLLRRAARRHLAGDPRGVRTGLLYTVLVFLSGALLQKFDLVVGTLCLVAVVAMAERRTWLAWGAIAAATLVKGFPLLALPVLIGYELRQARAATLLEALRARQGALGRGALAFGGALAAPTLVVVIFAGVPAVVNTITYQTVRGTEIESLYANVMLALGWLPGLGVTTAFSAEGLARIVHSRLEALVAPASIVLLAGALLAAYAATGKALAQRRDTRRRRLDGLQLLTAGVACVLLAFLLTFRVLPAHYLLVILPLAALLRLPSRRLQRLWIGGLIGVAVLGQVVEGTWQALVGLAPGAVLLLSVRNIAWIVAFAALVVALWQRPVELART